MRTNLRTINRKYTHEGGRAQTISPEKALRRAVLSCLLWEDQFYENGEPIAERINKLASECNVNFVAELAVEARSEYKLRHAPLWLLRDLIGRKAGRLVGDTIYQTIQRPDELTELVFMYWKDGKKPLSAQMKLGLARAFRKFDAYQLAKYNRAGDSITLSDVIKLCHIKPRNAEQGKIFAQLVNKSFYPTQTKSAKFPVKEAYGLGEYEKLALPDTWESNLVRGADKKETFTRLLKEGKLGYMALLRNLRGMGEVGVNYDLIAAALKRGAGKSRVLPFRFYSAMKAAPSFARELDEAMQQSLTSMNKLPGHTKLLIDVSSSMYMAKLSGKSDVTRADAACMLAVLLAGISERLDIYSFSMHVEQVPSFSGMALVDAVNRSQPHSGTYLGKAVRKMNHTPCDRLIVISDEQSHDPVPDPRGSGYMINVASYQNGVGYGKWIHMDGFSEAVVNFIQALETEE